MTAIQRFCVLYTILVALQQAAAQSVYAPAATFTTGPAPCSPVVADVNSDGRQDIICANYGANTLSVLTNNGSAKFSLAALPVVGLTPFAVAAGDLNGDGKADLVSVNFDDDTVSVLTNDGCGNFTLSTNLDLSLFTPTGEPTDVRLLDMDGNGSLDINVELFYSYEYLSLTNDGSGGFALNYDWITPPPWWIFIRSPWLTTTADVNGDTRPDLIEGSWNSTLSVAISIPTLAIHNSISNTAISWPSGWTGWNLLQSSNLTSWTTNSSGFDDGTNVNCSLTSPPNHLFFRLAY